MLHEIWNSICQRPVLWTGKLGKGQSITVPDLSKYTLLLMSDASGNLVLCWKSDRYVFGLSTWTLYAGFSTYSLAAECNGDVLTIVNCVRANHYYDSGHSGVGEVTITSIVGII